MRRRQHGARERVLFHRRRTATALLGLLALAAVAGCDSTRPPAAAVGATASAVPAPTASGNTGEVCQQINAAVAADLTAFGTDVGTLAGHQAGKNDTAASKASASAKSRLTTLAGKIRTAGQVATVAKVSAAAGTTATNLERLAADPGLLAGVHGPKDVPPVIQRVTSATDPMVNACV